MNFNLNIYRLVLEFYAIEAITAMLSSKMYSNFEPMRHSHSRWYRDFTAFREKYISRLASAIFDYTVLVVASELRHCREKASKYIEGYYTSNQERDDVFCECKAYKANDLLMAGMKLFDEDFAEWSSEFGGDKWKQIAKAGLMKGKVNDCIFIDHCVDLSHNNNIYFNKGAGIFILKNVGGYLSFLDARSICEPEDLLVAKHGDEFNKLLDRANVLNIIEKRRGILSYINECPESKLFLYEPIQWGTKHLDYSDDNIEWNYSFGNTERDYERFEREDDCEYKHKHCA